MQIFYLNLILIFLQLEYLVNLNQTHHEDIKINLLTMMNV